MSQDAFPPSDSPPRLSAWARFLQRLRTAFLTGVLVTAPIGLTIYLAWLFVDFVDSKVQPLVPARFWPDTYLPFDIPGVGLLIAILALTLIGAVTAGVFGRLLIRASEVFLDRMPVVRNIYGLLKQVFETVLTNQSRAFREVVLFEYPRKGIWVLGFITGIARGEVQEKTRETVVNVFLPTTPNPTSGFLLFIPDEDLIRLRMSVEEGIKLVISGGIVTPETVQAALDLKRRKPSR